MAQIPPLRRSDQSRSKFLVNENTLVGRAKRAREGGLIDHVLNRANGRLRILEDTADFDEFERIREEAMGATSHRNV